MADVQIAVIDQQNTEVTIAVPGVQGPVGQTGDVAVAQDGTAAQPGIRFENDTDVGLFRPTTNTLALATGGSERLRIDSSGRVGIGTSSPVAALTVVGSAGSGDAGIQITSGSTTFGSKAALSFVPSASPNFSTGSAIKSERLSPDGCDLQFFTVSSLGNTPVRAMTIDSSQRVGIGTTTVSDKLHVSGIIRAARSTDASQYGTISVETGNVVINAEGGINTTFENGGSEKVRIDSSGRLLVGTSTARSNFFNTTISSALDVEVSTDALIEFSGIRNRNNADGAVIALAKSRGTTAGSNTIVTSGDGLGRVSFQGSDGSEFVEAAVIQAEVDGTPGANDMPGRLVFSTTADGASSPTQRMTITSDGNVLVAKTAVADPSVVGCELGAAGYGLFTRASETVLLVNRTTDDGTLVSLRQSNIEEGTISVAGTTVSFNGAHLSRWSQIPGIDPYNKVVRPEILRGTVMSNLDEMCDWTCPESGECQDNEQLNKTKISDVEGDKNVAGIFQSWDDDDDTWVNDFYLAMTGDFVIRIAAGTTVERGDLLMSAGDGTAKPQSDDLVRSCTVAKVTSTNFTCTYDDGSYCVPCVLMAC